MGWGRSPSIAQLAHECLLYGTAGDGGPRAQVLTSLLEPEGRALVVASRTSDWIPRDDPQLGHR